MHGANGERARGTAGDGDRLAPWGLVPLARRNLLGEKVRFAMSVMGVAFSVMLVLVILSLYRGWSGAGAAFEQLPGNVWVTQAGTVDPFHSTSVLPADRARTLAAIPGVAAVIPIIGRQVVLRRGGRSVDALLLSLDVPAGVRIDAPTRQRFLPGRGRVVISAVAAGAVGARAGDSVRAAGRTLTIAHVEPGGNPFTEIGFVSPHDAVALLGVPGHVSFFLLRTRPGPPAALARAVKRAVPGSELHTSAEFSSTFARRVNRGFLPVVGVLVALGLVVGAGVIALTTYTATIERARDFGVLKAIGAGDRFLYRIVIQQSLLVGSLGAAVGVAVSAIAAAVIPGSVPEFVTDLRPLDVAVVYAAALAAALLAAIIPTRRISLIDPAMVFRA